MSDRPPTLYQALLRNAAERPDQPAAIDPQRTLSHAEYLAQVERLAAGLAAAGLQAGDHIAVLAQNSIAYLELYGACARIGTVAYPINWRLSGGEVAAVLSLAEPRMLVVGPEHLPQLEGVELDQIEQRVTTHDSPPEGFQPLATLYAETDGGRAGSTEDEPDSNWAGSSDPEPYSPLPEPSDDDPFVILSTAAVEGVPRGAVLTHANLMNAAQATIAVLQLSQADRHLAALPLFHVTGLGLSLATTLAGGANVVTPAFDPALSAQLIDQHRVTLLADFPPVLEMLLEARGQASWDSLRAVVGLDKPDVIQRLQSETDAKFWTGFGQSETSGVVTMGRADERPGSAGRPLQQAEIKLVDDLDREVPVGEPGEIVVRGPLVFAGYWRDPQATEFAARGGWHHTGDVGRFDQDGYLYYVGRKPEKALIKSGGENVYPAEVEQVLAELPQVAAVAVIGVPDEQWGEAVKAVIELEPGQELSAEQVVQAVAERIASFKKPRQVEFVEALPRTEDGQVDRARVQAEHG